MYIAYSAFQTINGEDKFYEPDSTNEELLLRYQAYQTVCKKYEQDIIEIQRYLPDWAPMPPAV